MEEWIRGPVIGSGSTSIVSLSFSTASSEVLAVKSTDLSSSASLQKETEFLSKLSSPCIVEYRGHEISEENGGMIYNLFMEYAPRGTLRDEIRLRGGRLKESMIRGFVREILSGLEYIHGKGIAHCDIKTQNILITDRGLKIADFGCAKLVDEECAVAFVGTPAYMAPEVARQEGQSYVADVWSVGCMVIEMAMGSLPWMDADDPVSALYRIGYSGEVPEPPQWLTEPARDFVRKCLMPDPKGRPSVKELLKHRFLLETSGEYEVTESSSIDHRSDGDSPNGVLEPRLWESMDSTNAMESIMLGRSSRSAGERMEEFLSMYGFPGSGQPDWDSEDDEWITVRAREETEDDSYANEYPPGNVLSEGEFSLEDPRTITIVNDSSSTIKDITVISDSQGNNHVFSNFNCCEDDGDLDCHEILWSIISLLFSSITHRDFDSLFIIIIFFKWGEFRWGWWIGNSWKRLLPKVKMEVLIDSPTHSLPNTTRLQ